MSGIPLSYRVHIWCGKTRMTGLQSGEGRMMIDSVVWAQYINVTDTQADTQTQQWSPFCRRHYVFERQKVSSVINSGVTPDDYELTTTTT